MLSRLIVSAYGALIEVALWLILIASAFTGWSQGGVGGALAGLLGAFVVSVVVFGAFLMLVKIQQSVASIEASVAGTRPQANEPAKP